MKKTRMLIDILMVLLFLSLMINQVTGVFAHEILGVITFILFIVHHIINRSFYKTIWKGKLTKLRITYLIVDVLLLIMMIIMIISSLLISQHIFTFLNLQNHTLGRMLHNFSAYTIYLLCALHLGLHLNTMLRLSKDKKIIVNVFLILFALIFGINGWIKKQFLQKITLQNLYPIYTTDNVLLMLIDYLGIFIMFVMIGYGIFNLIKVKKEKIKNEK